MKCKHCESSGEWVNYLEDYFCEDCKSLIDKAAREHAAQIDGLNGRVFEADDE